MVEDVDGGTERGGPLARARDALVVRWREAGRTGRLGALVAAVLVVGGVGTAAGLALTSEPAALVEVAPEPPPAPAPTPLPKPPAPPPPPPAPVGAELLAEEYGIEDLAAAGIRVEDDGLELITGIFRDGYDHLGGEFDLRSWTRNFRTRPATVEGFVEDAVVLLDPYPPCVDFHRQVRSISAGVAGEPGRRIEAALLEASGPRPFPYFGDEAPGSFPWCLDPAKDETASKGYILDEVLAVPCAMPGRALRCHVVTRWFYAQGVRDHWYAEAFVFDAATGERLEVGALHPGIGAERLDRLVRLALHVDGDVPLVDGEPEFVSTDEPLGPSFSVFPSVEGVRVIWLDYHRWLSPLGLDDRWVVVPWELIAAG